jgi:hypothetical protein
MIKITLRQHPDDTEMVEILERVEMKLQGRRSGTRTNVWALIHCDMFHDDEEIRNALKAGEEVDVVISKHIYSGSP